MRRFHKELKTFLRDILLIEPLCHCPAPSLLPFHPSPILSLSLSLILSIHPPYTLHLLPRDVSVYTSISVAPDSCIFVHFYPFTYILCPDTNLPGSAVYCQQGKRREMADRVVVVVVVVVVVPRGRKVGRIRKNTGRESSASTSTGLPRKCLEKDAG